MLSLRLTRHWTGQPTVPGWGRSLVALPHCSMVASLHKRECAGDKCVEQSSAHACPGGNPLSVWITQRSVFKAEMLHFVWMTNGGELANPAAAIMQHLCVKGIERQWLRKREREWDRQKERDTERETERDIDRERQRERQRQTLKVLYSSYRCYQRCFSVSVFLSTQ